MKKAPCMTAEPPRYGKSLQRLPTLTSVVKSNRKNGGLRFFTWTTPGGRTYAVAPDTYPA
jgi:hypothetical protein